MSQLVYLISVLVVVSTTRSVGGVLGPSVSEGVTLQQLINLPREALGEEAPTTSSSSSAAVSAAVRSAPKRKPVTLPLSKKTVTPPPLVMTSAKMSSSPSVYSQSPARGEGLELFSDMMLSTAESLQQLEEEERELEASLVTVSRAGSPSLVTEGSQVSTVQGGGEQNIDGSYGEQPGVEQGVATPLFIPSSARSGDYSTAQAEKWIAPSQFLEEDILEKHVDLEKQLEEALQTSPPLLGDALSTTVVTGGQEQAWEGAGGGPSQDGAGNDPQQTWEGDDMDTHNEWESEGVNNQQQESGPGQWGGAGPDTWGAQPGSVPQWPQGGGPAGDGVLGGSNVNTDNGPSTNAKNIGSSDRWDPGGTYQQSGGESILQQQWGAGAGRDANSVSGSNSGAQLNGLSSAGALPKMTVAALGEGTTARGQNEIMMESQTTKTTTPTPASPALQSSQPSLPPVRTNPMPQPKPPAPPRPPPAAPPAPVPRPPAAKRPPRPPVRRPPRRGRQRQPRKHKPERWYQRRMRNHKKVLQYIQRLRNMSRRRRHKR